MISPPFGINLLVIQGIRGRGKLSDVETSAPFVIALLIMIAIIASGWTSSCGRRACLDETDEPAARRNRCSRRRRHRHSGARRRPRRVRSQHCENGRVCACDWGTCASARQGHKSVAIALRQIAQGAVGQCVQKVGEAEALVRGGVTDVLVAMRSSAIVSCADLPRSRVMPRSRSASTLPSRSMQPPGWQRTSM